MIAEEDDFTDAIDFVQMDPDEGASAAEEEDEIDKKIAEEHEIFKEKEAQRWARPGSAPPLSSPRPDTIRAREEEKLAAAENPPPSGSRDEYVPPERSLNADASSSSVSYMMPPRPQSADSGTRRMSQGFVKPAGLQNILEDRPLQETSGGGSMSDKATPKESTAELETSGGKWVVGDDDDDEDVEEVEEEEEEGEEEEKYSEDEYENEIGEDDSPDPIVVPTSVSGRSHSPDVLAGKSRGFDQDPLADDDDPFEDDLGSDAGSAVQSSVAGTDFGDVMHPHRFALQLLTHDLRALPGFQKESENAAKDGEQEEPSLGQMGYLGLSTGNSEKANEEAQAKLVAASAAAIMASSQPFYGKAKSKSPSHMSTSLGRPGRPVSAPPVRPQSALMPKKTSGSGASNRPTSAFPTRTTVQAVPEVPDTASDTTENAEDSVAALLEASRLLRQSHQQRDQNGTPDRPSSGKPPLSPYSSPQQDANGEGTSNSKDPAHYWDDASTYSAAESGDCLPSMPARTPERSTYNGAAGSRSASSRPWTAPVSRSRNRPESARPGSSTGPPLRFARPHSAMPTNGAHRTTWDGNCTITSPTIPQSDSLRMTATVAVAGMPVSVYVADTMKRILQANQWLAKAGSSRRYRLKNPNSNMDIQVYSADDVAEVDGATVAPTLRNLTLKQFLTAHARLKAQHKAGADEAAQMEMRIRRNSEGMLGESWELRRSQSQSAGRQLSTRKSSSPPTAWASPNSSTAKARPASARPASGGMGSKSASPVPSAAGSNPYHSSRTYMSRHQRDAHANWDIEEGKDEEDEEVGDVGDLGDYDNECLSNKGARAQSLGQVA